MAKKDKKSKKEAVADDRFAEFKTDPRFMEMPKKAKKVKIDKKRFGAAFKKDNDFNTIGKFDKTGKKVNVKDTMMDDYYQLEDKDEADKVQIKKKFAEEESSSDEEGAQKKFYDEDGNF
mmetsp:Transcript_15936/g.24633  ORF Transcript_15936/g.24633 Transcript_15936/m.24633 type:complete len:119 (+) Transcript_15936:7-363(+)